MADKKGGVQDSRTGVAEGADACRGAAGHKLNVSMLHVACCIILLRAQYYILESIK